MRIARVDLWHVAIPLPAPFRPSWIPGFVQTQNRFDLIRLTTESGLEGYSAAPAMGRERAGFGALLGPYLLGERADDIASIRQRVREMGYLGWHAGWIEPACWDLVGKARGVPVYELLGGTGGSVGLYASTGEVRSGTERIDEVRRRIDEGFTGVKLRVHADRIDDDLEQIRTTAAALSDRIHIGVDANQAWRVAVIADAPLWDLDRARAFCAEAADCGLKWVEEPLPMDAYDELAELRSDSRVAISGGELNHSGLPEFDVLIARGCYDKYQPDAVFTGGIAETLAIARRAERAGFTYTPHTWTNGVGFAINLQVFACAPNRDTELLEYPLDPPGWVPEARDGLLVQPWRHEGGRLALPTLPGLGFEIDRAALRRHGRRFFTATKRRMAVRAVLDRGVRVARELGATRDTRLAARRTELARSSDDPALAPVRALIDG